MATLTTSYQLIANKYIGTVSGSGVAAKDIYLRIYAKYNSQNVVNNTSSVSYKSVLYSSGTGTYFYTGATTTKSLSGSGATTASGDAQGNYYLGETTLYEISGTVSHNSSGGASVSVTASWNSAPWGVGGSVTGTADLPTIARATTPTLSSPLVQLTKTITITMSPQSSTFKHKLRYNFKNISGSADGISIGADFSAQGNTTATFTPPASLGAQIPSSVVAQGEIVCYTYASDGTHIGTKTVPIQIEIPAYTPTVGNITLTGNKLLQGEYVQGQSTVTVAVNPTTQYGATIKSISAVVDSETYTSAKSPFTFTTKALKDGTKTVKITATDTRNQSGTVESAAFTVYEYAPPTITSFTLERQGDGTEVVATVKGRVSPVNNKNVKLIHVTLNGVVKSISSSSYDINGTATFTNVPTDETLTGTATIDDNYKSVSKDAVLPTVAVTMDFYKDGKGIALGKVAETTDTLEVAWKTKLNKAAEIKDDILAALTLKRTHTYNGSAIRFQNDTDVLGLIGMYGNAVDRPLRRWTSDASTSYIVLDTGNTADYVVEQGTTDGWEYTKWNNGKIELYANKSLTFPAGTSIATNLNRSIITIDLSGKLTNILFGSCPIQHNGMVPQVCRHTTYPTRAEIVILTSRGIDGFTITAPLYIIGKWK